MVSGFVRSNLQEVKSLNLWRSASAELLGTAYLVFLGCASCLGGTWSTKPSILQISLTFGIAVATVVYCISHISGGHINPAVSCAMLITRRITLVRCLVYIISQCIGAVIGASIVKFIMPPEHSGNLGLTEINVAMKSVSAALVVEALITFLLVFTVFSCCDSNRTQTGSVPLTIGLSVSLCHFSAIKYTGSSMNPARTFGPAFVMTKWDNHWVYWVGPIFGGIIAGMLYDLLFAENACPRKLSLFFTSKYDGEKSYDFREAEERELQKLEVEKTVDI